MEYSFKQSDLSDLSTTLLKKFTHSVIRIDGVMGAGKTTLISNLCKSLGVQESVSSPTFSLVNTYEGLTGPIYHLDFYRLEYPDEALDFGIEEYLESGQWCFMEWAEKVTPHLPLNYDYCKLEILDEKTRKLVIKKQFDS